MHNILGLSKILTKYFLFQYIIIDASTTLVAIVTMFLLLRMECSQILTQAEEQWQQSSASRYASDQCKKHFAVSRHQKYLSNQSNVQQTDKICLKE